MPVYAGTIRLAVVWLTSRRIGIYQIQCTAYKVAPEDGLIQSETCRSSSGKQRTIKSNYKNLVHLVGLYTYHKLHKFVLYLPLHVSVMHIDLHTVEQRYGREVLHKRHPLSQSIC